MWDRRILLDMANPPQKVRKRSTAGAFVAASVLMMNAWMMGLSLPADIHNRPEELFAEKQKVHSRFYSFVAKK